MSPSQFHPPTAKVLVVDDDRLVRSLLTQVLSEMGLPCVEAGSGEEAIRYLADGHADLVLLDIIMTGMDGLETLRVVREIKPTLPVIMTTGERKFDSVIEAMRLGAFDYVVKPFQVPILQSSIRRALDRRDMILEREELIRDLEQAKGYLENEVVRRSGLAAVGSLAAGVAHEFNNLMGAMVGYAELALRSKDPRLQEQASRVVLKSCNRAKHITGNLLAFAHRQQARRERCRLSALFDNTLALLEREFHKQKITVTTEFTDDDTALCDAGQISQVFFNVLNNARQAMPEGGKLSIRIDTTDDKHMIVIADEGVGIPRDLLETIFEPFASRGRPGTERIGLGLPVARTILENHKGSIEIESEVGRGTTMTIHLPRGASGTEAAQ